jgi:hypothetical protein
VVVLALTLAACGGDTEAKNDYVAAVNRAQTDFVAVVDDSQSRLADNASNEDTATQLDMIRAAAAKVVTRLRGVKPPDEVRSLHNSLVREAEGLVVAFRKAATAYRSGDSSRILTAKVDLTNDVTKVNEQLNTTINELNRKLHD